MGLITPISGPGSSSNAPPAPTDITLGVPVLRLSADQKFVEISDDYTPPNPSGTLKGIIPSLQAPDNVPSNGNAATLGNGAFIVGDANVAASLVPLAMPVDLAEIPYDPLKLILAIRWPVPSKVETWRLYARADSPDVTNALVTADKPNPTPNVTFVVDPEALANRVSGVEYAPLAASFTSPAGASVLTVGDGLIYSTDTHGNQSYTVDTIWTNDEISPRFPLLESYDVWVEWPDGSRHLTANPSPSDLEFKNGSPWSVGDAPQTFTLWLVSLGNDSSGQPQPNSIIPGLTPSVTYTVERQVGAPGVEYAPLVTGFSVTLPGYKTDGAGQKTFPVIIDFTPPLPPDTSWGGEELHLIRTEIAIASATNASVVQFTGVSDFGAINGQPVAIRGFTGAWEACNGSFPGTAIDPSNFTIPVDSTSFVAVTGAPFLGIDYVLTSGGVSSPPIEYDLPTFPSANETATVYGLSVATDLSANTYVPGVTPAQTITLFPPPSMGSGTEFTSNITPGTPFVTLGVALPQADGTYVQPCTVNGTAPTLAVDPTWGAFDVVVKYLDGSFLTWVTGAHTFPVSFSYKPTASVQNATFYVVSRDVNNRRNSIVDGTTPSQIISQGSGVGQLDFAKALSASLATYFTVTAGQFVLQDGLLPAAKLVDLSVATIKLAAAAVTTAKIANLAVDNAQLAALAVDAAKLANSAVTSTKIANLAVGTAAIAAAAVGTAQIANAAITSALIGTAQILTAHIGALQVTNALINDLAANKLTAGTFVAGVVYAGTINASQVNAGNLNAVNMLGGTLQLNANGITTDVNNAYSSGPDQYEGLKVTYNATGSFASIGYFNSAAAPGVYLKNSNGQLAAISSNAYILNNKANHFGMSLAINAADPPGGCTLLLADGSGTGGLSGHGEKIALQGSDGGIICTYLVVNGLTGVTGTLQVNIPGGTATQHFQSGQVTGITFP